MGWDGNLKWHILFEIRRELKKNEEFAQEMANEVWLTEKQLAEEMPFFKKSWLKEKGYKLHPKCVFIKDKNGELHGHGKRYYPRNTILKRLREEKIADDELTWTTYQYRLKGGELEIAGYEFNNKWQDGLSINEIIYHL